MPAIADSQGRQIGAMLVGANAGGLVPVDHDHKLTAQTRFVGRPAPALERAIRLGAVEVAPQCNGGIIWIRRRCQNWQGRGRPCL